MQLLSVNVGRPRDVAHGDRIIPTAIFKQALPDRVRVGAHNIEGDGQADPTVHGGVDLAVYAYPHEHYAYWEQELDRNDFTPGQFGENLTTRGLLEDDVRIGDVFAIGSARFEVTQPRVPCFKLALRMAAPEIVKLFLRSQRTGFYLRVLQEGEIGAGDAIARISTDPGQMTVREVFQVSYAEGAGPALIQRAMAMPALARNWREMLAKQLSAATA